MLHSNWATEWASELKLGEFSILPTGPHLFITSFGKCLFSTVDLTAGPTPFPPLLVSCDPIYDW